MTRVFQVFAAIVLGAFLLAGCNEGIQAPPEVPAGSTPGATGFSGVITYKNWPPADSLVDLRLVAFKKFPPGDILTEVLQDSAVVYPPLGSTSNLPFNVDTTHYFAPTPAGASYRYVVVAQRFDKNNLLAWRAVGQYDLDTNLAVPSPIQVPPDDTLLHVDINVDFNHLPPQPF
jgi:hypothetical protein